MAHASDVRRIQHASGDSQNEYDRQCFLASACAHGEVVTEIAGLNRNKAAGPDGLNNDFYKDTQTILAPAMLFLGNDILNRKDLPPSLLEGITISLR